MRFFEVEVVPFAVDVAGDQHDRIEVVLNAVSPRLGDEHFFGDGVTGAFNLRVAVPHLLLADR